MLLRAANAEWVLRLAEQSLDETLAEARGKKWFGSDLLLEPKRLELRRILLGYLSWEMELNESMFVVGKGGKPKRVRTGVKAYEEALGEINVRTSALNRQEVRHDTSRPHLIGNHFPAIRGG